jgi:transglutaminase-like putative cysteine protease
MEMRNISQFGWTIHRDTSNIYAMRPPTESGFTAITERFVPPVAGLDLVQSLNYVSAASLPLEWFYTAFTYPRTFYRAGSRPELEKFLVELAPDAGPNLATVRALAAGLPPRIKHFCSLGYSGEMGRGFTEEALIASGVGWCNEQARVLVALSQIAGMPSRLVFARGHVMTEVMIENHWVLLDQTLGFIFESTDGRLVNVADLASDAALYNDVSSRFRTELRANRETAVDKAFWEFIVTYGMLEDPLDILVDGYCNYFLR